MGAMAIIAPISLLPTHQRPKIEVYDLLTIEPETSSVFFAKFFSDTHFTTTLSPQKNGKGQGITFGRALKSATRSIEKLKFEPVLVGVGDIFGCLESWEMPYMPNEADGSLTNKDENLRILEEITRQNPVPMKATRRFLNSSEHARFILVEGNHDGYIFHPDSDNCRQFLIDELLSGVSAEEQNKKITFCKAGKIPTLGIQFEHGHRFDPFNYSNGKRAWGDWIVVKSNMIVKQIILNLKSCDLPPKLFSNLVKKTERMLRLRPSTAFPLYLNYLASSFGKKYEEIEPVRIKKANEVLMSYSEEMGKLFEELPFIEALKKRGLFPPNTWQSI
jgi:hypothetical protein